MLNGYENGSGEAPEAETLKGTGMETQIKTNNVPIAGRLIILICFLVFIIVLVLYTVLIICSDLFRSTRFALLHSTLISSTRLCSTRLCGALVRSASCASALLCSALLLRPALPYVTLLHSALLSSTLLSSAPFCGALLRSTLLCAIVRYSSLHWFGSLCCALPRSVMEPQ